jgi:flagellin-like hook-associated protein FlgL
MNNVNLDSAAVSLLSAYNMSQQQMTQIQSAVATGHDVNKASDNPLVYLQAQNMRYQAHGFDSAITKLSENKASLDRLQSAISNVSDTASKIRDALNSMSAAPSPVETQNAATNIKTYLNTLVSLITGANGGDGFNLNGGRMSINVAPNQKSNFANSAQTLTLNLPALGLGTLTTLLNKVTIAGGAVKTNAGQNYLAADTSIQAKYLNQKSVIQITTTFQGQPTTAIVDLSTATTRANFLTTVSNFINNTLATAAANVGAFSNALDANLKSMQSNQAGLNAQADALTKTDLTADSAKSTALSTQQQLLTSLMSMSNQRMSTVLSLFR